MKANTKKAKAIPKTTNLFGISFMTAIMPSKKSTSEPIHDAYADSRVVMPNRIATTVSVHLPIRTFLLSLSELSFCYIFYYFSRCSMIEQLNLHLFLVFAPIIRYNTYI